MRRMYCADFFQSTGELAIAIHLARDLYSPAQRIQTRWHRWTRQQNAGMDEGLLLMAPKRKQQAEQVAGHVLVRRVTCCVQSDLLCIQVSLCLLQAVGKDQTLGFTRP